MKTGAMAILARPRGALAGSLATALGGQAALVISGVFAARILGPEQRGYLALAVFIPVVLTQVVHLGLPQAVTFYAARDVGTVPALIARVLPLVIGQAVIAVLLHVALLPVFFHGSSTEAWGVALFALLAGPAGLGQQYALALLQGQRRFLAFNSLRLLPSSLYSACVLCLFILNAKDLLLVAAAWVLVQVAVAACSVIVALRGLPEASGTPPQRRTLIRFGLDGFLGSASPVETFRLDQAVIGLFLSPVALGLYVVGLSFTNLPRFIAQSVGMVAYPRIAAEADSVVARRTMWRLTFFTLAMSAAVVVPLWAAAGVLVPFFFGDEFAGAVSLTRLLLLASLLWATRRVLSDATRGLGLPRLGSIAEVASWIVLAPALALLMPAWGVEGVAVALVLASAASLVAMLALLVATDRQGLRGSRPGSHAHLFGDERTTKSVAARGG